VDLKETSNWTKSPEVLHVATPLWAKCEGEAHTPKSGKFESSGTPKNSELNCRGQISSHLNIFGVNGEVLKSRCPKWPRIGHLNICSPSYGQKKCRESNCQFDSRPLKVRNRLARDVHWGSATRHWKALFEGYKFGSDLVPRVQTRTVSGLVRWLPVPLLPVLQGDYAWKHKCY
jgi:hypothetical protein